eukprot:gnl/Trimastix_PCT/832.p1 GENE.gnl/Trimastix_PCT/832~~gnl/Trimastix_PCT/832.p1  ORF type:complete len:756 (+),score=274.35 gnl/Trimastix_PCT/832:84-2351(+)
MQRPRIPFLPGNTFRDPTKTDFRKSHTLGMKGGLPAACTEYNGIGGELSHTLHSRFSEEELEQGRDFLSTWTQQTELPVLGYIPAFVAYDKMVLSFKAYFRESVHESNAETYRVRLCLIDYYLEDDTICVLEPRRENSGIPQGVFLRRHRVPVEGGDPGQSMTLEDLAVGADVTIYGRTFHIYDCNGSTRRYLAEEHGREMAPAEPIPSDPHDTHRARIEFKAMTHPRSVDTKLRQFLKYDRNVLRFFCIWDDRQRMFGERLRYVLHYYLSDDTMEVVEVKHGNSGRDPFPTFVRRSKVPRTYTDLKDMSDGDFYTDADTYIGASLNIFNRTFLIVNCDDYTREHLRRKFGREDAPLDVEEYHPPPVARDIPPYLGLGKEEDTLATCFHLTPKPISKNFAKQLRSEHKILRFLARMETDHPNDIDRRFVVTYYLGDDSASVFEPPRRNSGMVHGKIIERARIKKPNSSMYYNLQDMYLGAVVVFQSRRFVLLDCDEYTKAEMQLHSECQQPDLARLEVEFRLRLFQDRASVLPALHHLVETQGPVASVAAFAEAVARVASPPTELELAALTAVHDPEHTGQFALAEFLERVEEAVALQDGGRTAEILTASQRLSEGTLSATVPTGAIECMETRPLRSTARLPENLLPHEEAALRTHLREKRAVVSRFVDKVLTRQSSLTAIFRNFTGPLSSRLDIATFQAKVRQLGIAPKQKDMELLTQHFFGAAGDIGYQGFVRGMNEEEKPLSFETSTAVLRS